MNKVEEMKKIIKPLVKECIREILFEEGIMKMMQESVQKQENFVQKKEPQQNYAAKERKFMQQSTQESKISLQEAKKKLLKEIAMTGFDPFAGTIPESSQIDENFEQNGEDIVPENKVLPGIQGSGVDISRLMGANKKAWSFYNNALKKGEKE